MVYIAIILCILNIGVTVYFLFMRNGRNASTQEEQKISRGLQLVQSKIAVLEDLSDQVDLQVKHITSLLDGKFRELQGHLNDADSRVNEIQSHVQRGQEVSKLFKDKIPHEEMVQRKNMVKYVKAAKMAYAGASAADIAQVVDLPTSEIEMIAKVNRNGLMFNDAALPDWIKDETEETADEFTNEEAFAAQTIDQDMAALLTKESPFVSPTKIEAAPEERVALKNLGEQFKKATEAQSASAIPTATESFALPSQSRVASTASFTLPNQGSAKATTQTGSGGKPAATVKPYEFRKITGSSLG